MLFYFRNLDWQIAMIFVFLFSIFLSWVLLLFFRKIRDKEVKHHHDVLTILLAFVTLVFGVQVSFVIMLEQQWINEGKKVTEREASYLASMILDAKRLSPENHQTINRVIHRYLKYILFTEWPAVEKGEKYLPEGENYLSEMWETYKSLPIQGEKETLWYDDSLEDLRLFAQARSERLALSSSSIHPILWAWILLLGLGTILLVAFVPIQNFSLNMFMMSVFTVTILMVLYLTFVLDHPFQGQIRVEPYEFKQLLKNLDAQGL